MTATLSEKTESLTGWGRTDPSSALLCAPNSIDQIKATVAAATPGSLIARGLGRSYGNPAQCSGGRVLELMAIDHIHLDPASGCVTCGTGASLDAVLRVIVPSGFFLPVTPGTRNVTVGGAIAADVHGKNHHGEGSFVNHVQWLNLVDGSGQLRQLSPSDPATAEAFWATAGGMGLTGVIVEACFRLIPISSSLISVDITRFHDLEALMAAMVEADARFRYSVAWVDSLHTQGRGVLTCGDHASLERVQGENGSNTDPLHYDPKALAGAPSRLPGGLLNTWTVRAFNEAWYRKSPKHLEGQLQAISPYFHPLDGVNNWNRIYGPAGFLQYQFAVPDASAHLVATTLEALRRISAPSFLTVLKRFGPGNPGPLSFPMPGWTLAADVSCAVPGLFELLDQLDEHVAEAGGRLYLAKDSRQSAAMLERSYPRLNEWRQQRALLDPRGVFSSDLARRVKL